MKQTIRLYVTTRKDPVTDLDDVKTAAELKKWKEDARKHALKAKEYTAASDALIADLQGYAVQECYAVVAYPPGSIHEADDLVGEELLKFLKRNSGRISWKLDETGASGVTVSEHAASRPTLDASHLWDNFTYGLIADKALGKDEYEVDLEVVAAG